MTQRVMRFPDEIAIALGLNITGHDPIHDYGSNDKRWEDNYELVKQFSNAYTFSNPIDTRGGNQTSNWLFRKSIKASTKPNPSLKKPRIIPFTTEGTNHTPRQYAFAEYKKNAFHSYYDALNELKIYIINSILFLLFNSIFLKPHFNIWDLDILYYQILYTEPFDCIITDVLDKVQGYFFTILTGYTYEQTFEPSNFLELIFYILTNTDIVIISILENISSLIIKKSKGISILKNISSFINKKPKGGGKKDRVQLDEANAIRLIGEITTLHQTHQANFERLNILYHKHVSDPSTITPDETSEYNTLRHTVLKAYQDKFIEYQQTQKSGSLFGIIDIIPILKTRISRYPLQNIFDNFKEKMDIMLLEYHKTITQAQLERASILSKAALDEQARLSGELSSSEKLIRRQFVNFIAKSSLVMYGVCHTDGTLLNTPIHPLLQKQISILLAQSGWTNTTSLRSTLDLDTEFLNLMKQMYDDKQKETRYFNQTDRQLYVVNNAAPLEKALKDRSFCPYTSILDGMSQCSYGSSRGTREHDNMNFVITNNEGSIFYNGRLTINPENPDDILVGFTIQPVNTQLRLIKDKQILLNGSELEAHFVLKNTLVKIIEYILSLQDDIRDTILQDNIFENLFNHFFNGPIDIDSFIDIYSELLFKVIGDLFQEANCVCRYGGYTNERYHADAGILPINFANGYTTRMFAANDRPSGGRFNIILAECNQDDINQLAFGGYYSINESFITEYKAPGRGGGKSKKQKTSSRRTRKRHHKIK
jgi:hypothetical protein